jgi:hypothetical protein
MLSSVPPRFTHPYGSDHVNGYVVFSRNVFAFLTSLLCVPNVFGLIKTQFFSFAKFVQRVLAISRRRHVLQIFDAIVSFVAILVVYPSVVRSAAQKCFRNCGVKGFVSVLSINRQGNKPISISAQRRHQHMIGVHVSKTTNNLSYSHLTNAKQSSYFSLAFFFGVTNFDRLNLTRRKPLVKFTSGTGPA